MWLWLWTFSLVSQTVILIILLPQFWFFFLLAQRGMLLFIAQFLLILMLIVFVIISEIIHGKIFLILVILNFVNRFRLELMFISFIKSTGHQPRSSLTWNKKKKFGKKTFWKKSKSISQLFFWCKVMNHNFFIISQSLYLFGKTGYC